MTEVVARRTDHRQGFSIGTPMALFLLVAMAVFPFIQPRGEQQASRNAATAAVWDQGALEITEYAELLGRDGAVVEGAVYTDKAPGQPMLAVPFYGAYRLLGGDPLTTDTPKVDLGLWWLTVWTAGMPLALLAVLMYRWSRKIVPATAMAATLTLVFGSLLLPYGTLLFGHVLAAMLAFAMFLLVRERGASGWTLFLAGLLGGFAVLTEFPLALIVAIVTVAAFGLHRAKAWSVIAGGLPSVALLGLYNNSLFGGPFVFSYQWNVYSGIKGEARGTLDIFTGPSIERFLDVLISERGLLIATPVIGIALIGLLLMRRRGWKVDTIVAALAFLSMLAIQMLWGNSYAGGPGPRYVTPGLAFLVVPLAIVWTRWSLVTRGLAIFSVLTMVLATVTNPQLGSEFDAGLGYWVRELIEGNLAPTVYTEALGWWGWLIHIGTVAGAAFLLHAARRDDGGRDRARRVPEPAS